MNMAEPIWDFECPQYVDFERELDNSMTDDVFFECKGSRRSLCTPEIQGKEKGLTESDENRLLSKMTAALSVLENTPKVKKSASRGKLFSEKNSKDNSVRIIKPKTDPVPRPKLRRSKSLDHLNKIISGKTNKRKGYGLRKSSSLNDFRTRNNYNKLKYPITPMCLKRTIVKAKEKIKTTEEMELEQIARLQKQLIQHLRQNEISLKRLNLRPRQNAALKVPPKLENSKEPKVGNILVEKSNVTEKESRGTARIISQAPMQKGASKQDTIINKVNNLNEKTRNTIYSRKSKVFSVSTIDLDASNHIPNQAAVREKASKLDSAVNNQIPSGRKTMYSQKPKAFLTTALDINKSTTQKTKKLTHNRILDHSGIMFIPSVKSNCTKSFIFEAKGKEMKPQIAGLKQKETSVSGFKENIDKENKDCIRPQSGAIKRQGIYFQNAKCDINKLAESNKIIGKRIANPLRGIPLAENVTRN